MIYTKNKFKKFLKSSKKKKDLICVGPGSVIKFSHNILFKEHDVRCMRSPHTKSSPYRLN